MVQDIVSGDAAKNIILEQDTIISYQRSIISDNNKIIDLWKEKYRFSDSMVNDYIQMDIVNNNIINAYKRENKKVKRQRNVIIGVSILGFIGLLQL